MQWIPSVVSRQVPWPQVSIWKVGTFKYYCRKIISTFVYLTPSGARVALLAAVDPVEAGGAVASIRACKCFYCFLLKKTGKIRLFYPAYSGTLPRSCSRGPSRRTRSTRSCPPRRSSPPTLAGTGRRRRSRCPRRSRRSCTGWSHRSTRSGSGGGSSCNLAYVVRSKVKGKKMRGKWCVFAW